MIFTSPEQLGLSKNSYNARLSRKTGYDILEMQELASLHCFDIKIIIVMVMVIVVVESFIMNAHEMDFTILQIIDLFFSRFSGLRRHLLR